MAKEIIKSIELNIGDVTVKVSVKQANELYAALADLLGKPHTTWAVSPISWQPPLTVTSGSQQPFGTEITIN